MTGGRLDDRLSGFEAELFERNGSCVPAAIRAAFRTVRRDRFVREWFERGGDGRFQRRSLDGDGGSGEDRLAVVYSDRPLVIAVDPSGAASSSSSQPSLMMMMLVHLDPRRGMRALEIGAGTGYNAALLAHVVGPDGTVVTLEISEELAERAAANLRSDGVATAVVLAADGSRGCEALGPYDRMIVTVGAQAVHDEWVSQLADGGRIVLPLQHGGNHVLTVLDRQGGEEILGGYFAGWSSFVAGVAGLRFAARVKTCPLRPGQELLPAGALPGAGDFPDFWFFAGLEHPGATTVRLTDPQGGVLHVGPGIVTEGDGVAVLAPDSLRIVGDEDLAGRIGVTLARWEAAGRPRLGDYAVELHPSPPAPTDAWEWARSLGSRTEVVRLRQPGPGPDVPAV